MNERLHAPVKSARELDVQERTREFADYILEVYEGKGMGYHLPQDDLQEVLEKGHGAPGEYSFVQTTLLFHQITKEERPLFLKAIGTLIENPEIPEYIKAALLYHSTLTGFMEVVQPSVEKLLETPQSSAVLQESLEFYSKLKRLEELSNFDIDYAPPKLPEKTLVAKDYKLTKTELNFSPDQSRAIINDWVMHHNSGVVDEYSFYPFGRPRELKYRYLDLDIWAGETPGEGSVIVSWYDNYTLEDFLPVANLFTDTILPREKEEESYRGKQYDSPPGIYVSPDSFPAGNNERIHIPFPGVQRSITYKLLEQELRRHEEFINYTLDECSINLLTPKGNQLDFTPYVPDDADRHPIDISFPEESRFFLQLYGPIPTEAIVPIIREGSRRELPLQTVETILQKKFGT